MLHTLTRTLAAALAVVALAAPSALARPLADPPAEDAKPRMNWSYGYEAPIPRPGHPSQPARTVDVVTADDGSPWALIAGLAGGCLLLGGLAATATRKRVRATT